MSESTPPNKSFGEHVTSWIEPFRFNLTRVQKMLEVCGNELIGDVSLRDDLLRATVVLLHATMEELLREAGRRYLPEAQPSVLEYVNIAQRDGDAEGNRKAPPGTLATLAPFLSKSVRDVFSESIEEHLNKKSFNNVKAVHVFLVSIGIGVQGLDSHREDLTELIQRRHHIAHRGDLMPADGSAVRIPRTISIEDVRRWHKAVIRVLVVVMNHRAPFIDLGGFADDAGEDEEKAGS